MLAFKRFSARRGVPNIVYSDNAKTFVAATEKVLQSYGSLAPDWRFIVPRSPWHGGFYEVMVKLVKSALKKTLGTQCVTRIELETCLTEIEACVNSRPLLYIPTDSEDFQTISPSHFLLGRSNTNVADDFIEPENITAKNLFDLNVSMSKMLNKFWSIWHKQYLTSLPVSFKGFKDNCNLTKGKVVLIKEDHIPRLKWPLGLILDVLPGNDGKIRAVRLKTAKGIIKRPVQKLYDLEIMSNDSDIHDISNVPVTVDDISVNDVPVRTRAGRVSKVPDRLEV